MQRVQLKKLGRRVQKGFTLIELMIVVAIIGILAAIAIPQYQDYVTRARWSDNLTSIAPLKQVIAECIQNNSQTAIAAPCNDDTAAGLANAAVGYTAGMPAPTNGSTVAYAAGVITITGSASAGNCVVTVTPTISATAVTWAVANVGGAGGAAACTKSKTGV
ncbi:pilin [Cupriavidus lacunae]|uniref:Pilus assembly protein PilA n=1 Tax=Cupriavidus lacunae TaxID=2666307 RepID=A0A370NK40_9BURK|nr:prepilin-type N-terminal cleavage/methylation domain-containing protein [Cupriavidus lacunae]RDK05938.1 pilus assembly protein PilA [Cupriavidus lacunae]